MSFSGSSGTAACNVLPAVQMPGAVAVHKPPRVNSRRPKYEYEHRGRVHSEFSCDRLFLTHSYRRREHKNRDHENEAKDHDCKGNPLTISKVLSNDPRRRDKS